MTPNLVKRVTQLTMLGDWTRPYKLKIVCRAEGFSRFELYRNEKTQYVNVTIAYFDDNQVQANYYAEEDITHISICEELVEQCKNCTNGTCIADGYRCNGYTETCKTRDDTYNIYGRTLRGDIHE